MGVQEDCTISLSLPLLRPTPHTRDNPVSRPFCPQHLLTLLPLLPTPTVLSKLIHSSKFSPESLLPGSLLWLSLWTGGSLLSYHSCSVHWGLSNLKARTASCFFFCFSYVLNTERGVVDIQGHLHGSIINRINE